MYRSSTAPDLPRMSTTERQEMFRRIEEQRRAREGTDSSPDHEAFGGGASLLRGDSDTDDQQHDQQHVVFTSQGTDFDNPRKRKASSSLHGSSDGSASRNSSLDAQGHGRLASISDFEPDDEPDPRLFTSGVSFSGVLQEYDSQEHDDERHSKSPEPRLDVRMEGYAKYRPENADKRPDYKSFNTFGDSEDLTTPVASSSRQEAPTRVEQDNSWSRKLQNVPTGTVNNPRQRQRQHEKRAAEPALLTTRGDKPPTPAAGNQFRPKDNEIYPIRQPSQPKFGPGEGSWRRKDDEPSAAAGIQGNWRLRSEDKTTAGSSRFRFNFGDSADNEAATGGRASPFHLMYADYGGDSFNQRDCHSDDTVPLFQSDVPMNMGNAGPRRGLSGSQTTPNMIPVRGRDYHGTAGPRPNPLFGRGLDRAASGGAGRDLHRSNLPFTTSTVGVHQSDIPLRANSSIKRTDVPPAAPGSIGIGMQATAGMMGTPEPVAMTDTQEMIPVFDLRASAGYRAPDPPVARADVGSGAGRGGPGSRRTSIVGLGPAGIDPFSTAVGGMPKSSTIQSLAPARPVPLFVARNPWHQRSAELNALTNRPGGRPTFPEAMDPTHFPFVESATLHTAHPNRGVVKIVNIPFTVTRAEVIGYLGRNAGILNDTDEPVHIIMERTTNKTNDVYIEFISMHDAMNAVNRNHRLILTGRSARLGERPAAMELSSSAALMKDLFPLARGVYWTNDDPIIIDARGSSAWEKFKGFITAEEMTMLVKHVECPQRSPFAKDCPQRPFEHMISVLKKLPWNCTHTITMSQRHAVYRSCIDLVCLLQNLLRSRDDSRLNQMLLKRLVRAAMGCAGFTVVMKDNIAYQARLPESELSKYSMPRFPESWRHAYSFTPKHNYPFDVIEWYIAVIREETRRKVQNTSFLQRKNAQAAIQDTDAYFGYFWTEIGYPVGVEFDNMTLAEVAILEFGALENVLRRALSGGKVIYY